MQKYKQQLLKILKSNKYDFIVENKGYIIDGITQYSKLTNEYAKPFIKYTPVSYLKERLIVVKKRID